ncbi:glycosyltransferase family 4 protein [Eggerthellaceae bacterium 24-137]
MRVLVVIGGFFPAKQYGGPPVSINNLCSLLASEEFYIITKNHDLGESKAFDEIHAGWNDRGNCKVAYLSDRQFSSAKLLSSLIDEVQPDFIYLQSLFHSCTMRCLLLAKMKQLPVLLAPRGELCRGAMRKKYKKLPYILLLKASSLVKGIYFQSTSPDETVGIRKYFGRSQKVFDLENVASLPKETPSAAIKKPGTARIVFLSRIVPKKNLLFALSCLQEVRGSVQFDIYGPIEEPNYYKRCVECSQKLPANITVSYRGVISQCESQQVFSGYDLFLFPTQSENFGHVIAEALSAGCPVAISDQTPWIFPKSDEAGCALPLNEKTPFIEAVQTIVDSDHSAMERKRLAAKAFFKRRAQFELQQQKYLDAFRLIATSDSGAAAPDQR